MIPVRENSEVVIIYRKLFILQGGPGAGPPDVQPEAYWSEGLCPCEVDRNHTISAWNTWKYMEYSQSSAFLNLYVYINQYININKLYIYIYIIIIYLYKRSKLVPNCLQCGMYLQMWPIDKNNISDTNKYPPVPAFSLVEVCYMETGHFTLQSWNIDGSLKGLFMLQNERSGCILSSRGRCTSFEIHIRKAKVAFQCACDHGHGGFNSCTRKNTSYLNQSPHGWKTFVKPPTRYGFIVCRCCNTQSGSWAVGQVHRGWWTIFLGCCHGSHGGIIRNPISKWITCKHNVCWFCSPWKISTGFN